MNLLPIATRELRVAARRSGTYRMRWLTALIAMLVSGGFLSFFTLFKTTEMGSILFMTLSSYVFGLCALAGVFLTADSLTEEKREGTLGLLLLTDLKGYDVILGKFMAASLNAFYGLLAVMPILALPMMIGGVTGSEYWRMNLALANTLFFSLACGMWISARTRDSQRAMTVTAGLLLMFGVLLPMIDQLGSALKASGFWRNIAWLSPAQTFLHAFDANFTGNSATFWNSLIASHLCAWLFLALASRLVPHSWQDKPLEKLRQKQIANWSLGGRERHVGTREKLLEQNPILWLMSGGKALRWGVWLLAIIAVVISVGIQHFIIQESGTPSAGAGMMLAWVMWPIFFIIKILAAVRASYFFAESRRTGAIELLLATPLTNRQIVQGQWLGLKRIFFGPVMLIVVIQLSLTLISLFALEKNWDTFINFITLFFSGGVGLYGIVKFVMDLLAVVWFGLWMGLSCKQPNRAALWTVLVAILLPSVLFCVPDIAVDLFLILWSKNKLELDLRSYLTGDLARIHPGKNYNENFGMV